MPPSPASSSSSAFPYGYIIADVVTTTLFPAGSEPSTTTIPVSASSKSQVPVPQIIGGTLGGVVLALLICAGWIYWGKKIRAATAKQRREDELYRQMRENTRRNASLTSVPQSLRPSLEEHNPTNFRRPSAEYRPPSTNSRRPSVESRRPSVDSRRPSVDSRRSSMEGRPGSAQTKVKFSGEAKGTLKPIVGRKEKDKIPPVPPLPSRPRPLRSMKGHRNAIGERQATRENANGRGAVREDPAMTEARQTRMSQLWSVAMGRTSWAETRNSVSSWPWRQARYDMPNRMSQASSSAYSQNGGQHGQAY